MAEQRDALTRTRSNVRDSLPILQVRAEAGRDGNTAQDRGVAKGGMANVWDRFVRNLRAALSAWNT